MPIRLSKASLGPEEKNRICEVLDNDYLGMGTYVKTFEDNIKTYLQTSKEVVTANTGTSALHIAVEALNLNKGDYVAVPSITYVASLQAISAAGMIPLICDVKDNGFLDVQDLDKRIHSKVKAVMPVHYASSSNDMPEVYDYASSKKLRVIEDAAHSFGCLRNDKKVGAQSEEDIVCFSFDGIKNITCGEGGALLTSDKEVAKIAADVRLLAVENDTSARFQQKRSWDFDVKRQGYRYHLSNTHAAIGIEQLKKIETFRAKKAHIFASYLSSLSKIDGVKPLLNDLNNMIPHIFVIELQHAERKAALREFLLKNDIQSGEHYKPNHLLSFYKTDYELPKAMNFYKRHLSIPFHADLTDNEVEAVAQKISEFFHG